MSGTFGILRFSSGEKVDATISVLIWEIFSDMIWLSDWSRSSEEFPTEVNRRFKTPL